MKRLVLILLASQILCLQAEATQIPPGRGGKTADTLSVDQWRRIEKLKALGYLAGSFEAAEETGVTIYDESRAYRGLNFYTSGHGHEAFLVDMDGNVLHSWACDANEAWFGRPGGRRVVGQQRPPEYWRRGRLLENGDLIVVYTGQGIARIDKDSNVLWGTPVFQAHHDFDIGPNGDVYVASRNIGVLKRIHRTRPVMEDCISVLDQSGSKKSQVSLIRCFENSREYRSLWENRPIEYGDVLHLNTVELLQDGNVLVSFRNLDAIAIVDMKREVFTWVYQGEYRGQHEPTMLPNGNLLLFNNNWSEVEQLPEESSVLEYEFPSMKLVWAYRSTERAPLYTVTCGTAQRLPNGNTLITESDRGRAFEVTRDGEIVWEYYSPHRVGKNREVVATMFHMDRLKPDFPLDWLEE